MRNYQPSKNNNYKLAHSLFMHMVYLVKDYPRMKSEINDVINSVPNALEQSSNNHFSDPTGNKVVKIEKMSTECKAVELALDDLPIEYRKSVFDKVCHNSPYPIDADRTTYGRWKCRFLWNIAKNLLYI